ncbi:MAG: DEAD/DEAH box helicase [Oligoflexia bacterium]|nr:DEAD/DEAH box helicase [Oligoflexia bacterium]
MEKILSFESLGLSSKSLEAIKAKGFEIPTPIQSEVIPLLLDGRTNIVAQSKTGTGKTAAFALPLIEQIHESTREERRKVQALILTPTRELAVQVSEELSSIRGPHQVSVFPIYGGQSFDKQIKKIKQGLDIIVGTPGRVIDLINRGILKLEGVRSLILDEADEMLNMGFLEQVEEILQHTDPSRQMLLFSATMPPRILQLIKKYMGEYKMVGKSSKDLTSDLTVQIYFEVKAYDRTEVLCRIIDVEDEFYGLVFCRTKIEANDLATALQNRGYDAEALHGDISQQQREIILKKFRNRVLTILVATDVAARGIDVSDLTHVINYSLPQNPEAYIHRIGRTGRAGKQGKAITFVTPSEYQRLNFIKRMAKAPLSKGPIPRREDVLLAQKKRIIEGISKHLADEDLKVFADLAKKLQEKNKECTPDLLLAATLKSAYSEQLLKYGSGGGSGVGGRFDKFATTEAHVEREESAGVDDKGTCRLFVALGKKDGLTKRDLITNIKSQVKIETSRIREIEIYDTYSFITVSFKEAEMILDAYKRLSKGRARPLIEHASNKKDRK